MSARTYTVGKARVLELPGVLDLVINLKSYPASLPEISVGLFEPITAGQAFRPALAWSWGSRCVLQDDAQGNEAHAALWIADTQFRVATTDVPLLINFLGDALRDGRHDTSARASA